MKTDIKVIDRLLALHLEVNIWSARKKLCPEDFSGAVLPPEDLASLGSKRICDPEDLRVFGMLKSRAVSLLDRHGIRFLGGWAVAEEHAEEIIDQLTRINSDFDTAKEEFLARYDQSVQEWINKHAGWERIIAQSTVSAEHVRSRMGFSWKMYRIMPPRPSDPSMTGLSQEVENLGATLFGEVSKTASEAWYNCFAGKTSVTRKALSPLKTMHRKLCGLSFVEPRVAPVAELIATAMDSLPKRGRIEGGHLIMLQGLISLLRDTRALVEHGQMIIDGTSSKDVLELLLDQGSDGKEDTPIIPPRAQPVLASCGLW